MVNNFEIPQQYTFVDQHEHDVHIEGPSMVVEENEPLRLMRVGMEPDVAASQPSIQRPVEGLLPFDNQRLHLLSKEILKVVQAKAKAFRLEVNKKTEKPVAVEAHPQANPQLLKVGESSSQRKRKKCDVAGEVEVSFELPLHFLHDALHLDLVLSLVGGQRRVGLRFSVVERLNDWKIQMRQRSEGRYDSYFYHKPSGGFFRSVTEVKDFILLGTYPPNTTPSGCEKRAKKLLGEDAAAAVEERSPRTPASALAIQECQQQQIRVQPPLQQVERPINGETEILPEYLWPQLYEAPENQEVEYEILDNGCKLYKFI